MSNLTIKQAKQTIYFCDSYSRLEAVLNLYGRMRLSSWLRILGESWPNCDNISQFQAELSEALEGIGTIHELMTRAERRQFDKLPEVVPLTSPPRDRCSMSAASLVCLQKGRSSSCAGSRRRETAYRNRADCALERK